MSNGGAVQASGSVTVNIVYTEFLGQSALGSGGALAVDGGQLYLSSVVFRSCSALQMGGALNAVGSRSWISDVTFENCTSTGEGGAVVISGGSSTIYRTNFSLCSSGKDGGAIIQNQDSAVNISYSYFSNLSSGGYGGAMSVVGGKCQIQYTKLLSCHSAKGGGAIFASDSPCYGAIAGVKAELWLQTSTLGDCFSYGSGGAVLVTSGDVVAYILSSSLVGCWSTHSGGALSGEGGAVVTVRDSRFLNNSCSRFGGAISSDSSAILVQSSLFITCSALGSGGAISVVSGASSQFENISFLENKAYGTGGGALYSANGNSIILRDLTGHTNSAPNGGGGFLFLEGGSKPVAPALDESDFVQACKANNFAAYGRCVASSGNLLWLSGMPTSREPAYPGIPFSVSVVKKDAYNQTMITDSSSVLFAQSASRGFNRVIDPFLSISGEAIAQLQKGAAQFSIVLKPAFKLIEWISSNSSGLATLASAPFLYFYGTDLDTMLPIYSEAVPVALEKDSNICPAGYFLSLDAPGASGLQVGTCIRCLAGKYSVNPLAGIFQGKPSCLNCPAGGTCGGGDEVSFRLGRWLAVDGLYRLVGCPAGYQLFNMIGGTFSHDIQQCLQCKQNEYILDSNNSAFSCQPCPSGAKCDGANLEGLVPESVWRADLSSGKYVLVSCPPAYELLSASQECALCQPGFYCKGGSDTAQACPQGYFARIGANSSSACSPASIVSVTVSLPLSKGNFTGETKNKFVSAISMTAGVPADHVVVVTINQQRRANAAAIMIASQIAVKDTSTASSVAAKLDPDTLNRNLILQGLPQGTLVSVATSTTPSDGNTQSVIIIVVILGSLFCTLIIAAIFLLRRVESEEEHILRRAMEELRVRLRISKSNSFLLSTESSFTAFLSNCVFPWSGHHNEITIIQRCYLEAAARLALMQVGIVLDES